MASVGILVNTSWNIINFRLKLIRYLKNNGYRVVVFIPDNMFKAEIESAGADVVMIAKLSRKGTNPIHDYQLYKEYTKRIGKAGVDIVLGFTIKPNIYGAMACKKLHIPFMPTITGLGSTFINKSVTTWVARRLYKYALQSASAIFFQNPDDKSVFVNEKLIDSSKAHIIPGSGIDTHFFQRDIELVNEPDSLRFLYVGRLLRDKGIYELFEAANRLHKSGCHFQLLIVGDVDPSNPTSLQKSELENWRSKPFLQFLGYQSDVRHIMKDAQCVILPSYREGLPRVILEAMSMSLPVITNDVPGCRSLVTHNENGWLCEPKNVDDLYWRMKAMCSLTRSERDKMGLSGRQKCIQKHDAQIINEMYVTFIKVHLKSTIF